VELRTDVDYLDVELLADGGFDRDIDGGRNTLLYVIEGEVKVAGDVIARGSGVLLTEGKLHVAGVRGSRFAYLSGRPHHEPILHRGPFVD
jgi:redox-sensitive bicupin YhaK (pirin superfamily)